MNIKNILLGGALSLTMLGMASAATIEAQLLVMGENDFKGSSALQLDITAGKIYDVTEDGKTRKIHTMDVQVLTAQGDVMEGASIKGVATTFIVDLHNKQAYTIECGFVSDTECYAQGQNGQPLNVLSDIASPDDIRNKLQHVAYDLPEGDAEAVMKLVK